MERRIEIERNGYELVTYLPGGESRIEHPGRGEASAWLDAREKDQIHAEPASMEDWNLDETLGGRWEVECRDAQGEWHSLDGEYATPSPHLGGTEEQVIAEERASAARAGVEYEDGSIRAMWVEE